MLTVLAFLKAHWRPIAVLVALVAAFGAGRFATPTKVHVVQVASFRTVTVEAKERVVFKDRVVQVDRVVTKVIRPDGTVTETISDKSKRETKTADAEKSSSAVAVSSEVKTEKTETHDAPRFTVSLLGGYAFSSGFNLIPGAGGWSLGLQLQYRIVGPLQVGVFGLSTGTAGLSLGLTF